MFQTYLDLAASLKGEVFQTAMLALVVLFLMNTSGFTVAKGQSPEAQRFWRLTFRHIGTAVFVLGLIVVWRKELQGLVLALGAATAGFLIAFRENWLSLLAFWIRMVKRQYGLNDFVEIDGLRGRVLDITWLTTTLAETSSSREGLSYSGRVVHVPNNRFLLAPVMVENLTGEYSAHLVKVHLPTNADILKAEALVLAAAERQCAPFYAEAEQHMTKLRNEQAIDTPTVAPRTRILLGEYGHATIFLRVVVPFKDKSRVEQAILHDFLKNVTPQIWPKQKVH